MVYLNDKELKLVNERISLCNSIFQDEFEATDPRITVELQAYEESGAALLGKHLSTDSKNKVITSLLLIPNGVFSMNKSIDNLVRSSSNIGSVKMTESEVVIESLVRSSLRSQLDLCVVRDGGIGRSAWLRLPFGSIFSGSWPYCEESKLRDIFAEVYLHKYGKEMKIKAIHAGLECGILVEKMPYLDVISYGADMFRFHTPEEHLVSRP